MKEPRQSNKGKNRVPLRALARVASVAAGVQFGWALQLSLLTPYVQELGISHVWASYIWLCGPVSGMLVQPLVGHLSDQCESQWGRRRPFIVTGALLIVVAVIIIAFSADLGYVFGDTFLSRPRAITIFVLGFWILDLANNTMQGPCRALLADFTGKDHRRTRRANTFYSLFMGVGNVLGYATGSYNGWHKILPFTQTVACGVSCANLKSAFLLDTIVLIITTALCATATQEIPWYFHSSGKTSSTSSPIRPLLSQKPISAFMGASQCAANEDSERAYTLPTTIGEDIETEDEKDEPVQEAFFWEIFSSLRDLPKSMWNILLVTALTWISWFPFVLFDTDWMGREVYGGEPSIVDARQSSLYNKGVRAGSFGLMLNSVVLGFTSLMIEPLCRKIGQRSVWTIANVIMFACFAGIVIISVAAKHSVRTAGVPSSSILVTALLIFAILGAPLAVTYSVPYGLASSVTNMSGGGQGKNVVLVGEEK
eukprot:c24461_g1_i1 orf=446-1894(+)